MDLGFLRDEERAPLSYAAAGHGFRLSDDTYTLPPVAISRREAFSFGLARKRLAPYEGTPLHPDMRAVRDKIAESLEGDITIEPGWLSENVGVLPEDRVRRNPDVWARLAGFIKRREAVRMEYHRTRPDGILTTTLTTTIRSYHDPSHEITPSCQFHGRGPGKPEEQFLIRLYPQSGRVCSQHGYIVLVQLDTGGGAQFLFARAMGRGNRGVRCLVRG